MEHDLLRDILVILGLSVITITLCGRLRIPSIISYLVVGILAGPNAMGWLTATDTTRLLGEIGVVFLLFTIGLDFSLEKFWSMKKSLFGLGGAQVLVGTVSGAMIAWFFGIAWQGALIVGGALALSSTAIVIKQLSEQLELQTEPGRLSFSILLFQDLAAVPFLVLIPILANGDLSAWVLLIALLKALAAMFFILIIGRWILRPIFHEIALPRSLELFTLTVLLISLTAAWVTHKMGLSLGFGAFLAGMMLSETEFRHQIEIEIRPFRDVLLGLFFITVGMQLNMALFPDNWLWVLSLLSGVMIGKGFFIYLLLRITGYNPASSLRTGLILGQGGEFGIALLILAVISGLLSTDNTQPILMAVILSMALSPLIIKFNSRIASSVFKWRADKTREENLQGIKTYTRNIDDYVVICGFGRVGKIVAESLYEQGVKYIGLDTDPDIIKLAWREGEPVFFGDATHISILEAADLRTAKALVISLDNPDATLKTLRSARIITKDVPVIVRSRDDSILNKLLEEGADEIITEKLETGIMMSTQLLLLLGRSADEVFEYIKEFRKKQHKLLQKYL